MPNTNDDKPYEEGKWTSADGLTLSYRDYPQTADGATDAAPLLCLHGLTRNARDFAPLAAHIAGRRRMIVPDMRGRGKSDPAKDSATYNPAQYVEDVAALLGALSIDRVVAVGTSMGGIMTMLMAHDRTIAMTGAVLNDIGPVIDNAGLDRIKDYVGQGRSFPTWMHAARALQDVHRPSHPGFTIDDWLLMAKRNMIVSQSGRIAFDYDMAIAEAFAPADDEEADARSSDTPPDTPSDMWRHFDALSDTPLLLIRGAVSDLLSAETVAAMAARASRYG